MKRIAKKVGEAGGGWFSSHLLPYRASLIMLLAVICLQYIAEQSDFELIFTMYGILFAGYLLVWRYAKPQETLFFLLLGVVLRLVVVFGMPGLSDDVYRFIWDGHVLLKGINPFEQTPRALLEAFPGDPHLTEALFRQLNSPDYFTVYPPVAQATFLLSVWLFPHSWLGAAVVMKVIMFFFEIGSLWLLWRLLPLLGFSQRNVLLYALNPLIIIEITGNLHHEGAMIFFLLLSLWLALRQKWMFSSAAMALAVATKLLPLLFLPFLIARLGLRRSLGYFGLMGGILVLLFAPLPLGPAYSGHFGESLNLYFQRFEFNASVYYLLRWGGFQLFGYNLIGTIGPLLGLLVLVVILTRAFLERAHTWERLPLQWLFAICLYLAFSTTVHPWYLSLPIVLCLFTPYRFPLLWSALITLTYINYSYPEYQENLWMVGVEYVLTAAWLIWEWRRPRP